VRAARIPGDLLGISKACKTGRLRRDCLFPRTLLDQTKVAVSHPSSQRKSEPADHVL